jgi:signal transduction histidine kinase
MNISILFFSYIVVALLNIILGLIVYFRGAKTAGNRYFFLFTLFVALWTLSMGFFSIANKNNEALILAKLMFSSGLLVPFWLFLFSKNFPDNINVYKLRDHLVLIILPLVINVFLFKTNYLISTVDTSLVDIRERIFFGPAMLLYVAYFIGGVGVSFRNLRSKYLVAKGLEKIQLNYVTKALMYLLVYTCLVNVFLPALKIFALALSGPFFSLLFIITITYAIVKHRIMNIDLAIKRSLMYAVLIGVILTMYIVVIITLDLFLKTGIIYDDFFLLILTLAITLTAVTFSPLESWLKKVTDKIFFKGEYNYRETLKNLGKTVSGLIDLDKLLSQVTFLIQKTIKVNRIFFFVYDKESKQYVYKNYLESELNIKNITENSPMLRYVKKAGQTLIYHEVKSMSRRDPSLKLVAAELELLGIRACIPIISRKFLFGVLCLGEKMSGDVYTTEDTSLFDTFDYQLATAFENAFLHREAIENQKRIARANRLATIGTMTTGIAHEIKNPMVALKTFSELLPKKFNDANYREKYMDIVPREVDRINALLESLLTLGRKPAENTEKVVISDVVNSVYKLLKNRIEEKNVDFEASVDKKYVVFAEKDQIIQVFINLFLNAMQAMPEGGTLKVEGLTKREKYEIHVKDSGIGIPEQNLHRLFDPFFTTRHEGTGLGLPIIQKIIEDHGGHIDVKSKPKKGADFIISFPLKNLFNG